MQYGFDTESVNHGKAALLLYAMYMSRDEKSSLNGLETWDRCNSYAEVAALKSTTVAEFVQHFCKKANIGSIKPIHLETDGLVNMGENGELVKIDGVYNYRLDIFGNQEILDIISRETLHIIFLVREKLQREKFKHGTEH